MYKNYFSIFLSDEPRVNRGVLTQIDFFAQFPF